MLLQIILIFYLMIGLEHRRQQLDLVALQLLLMYLFMELFGMTMLNIDLQKQLNLVL